MEIVFFAPESRCRNEFKSKLIANPAKSNSLSRITKTSSPTGRRHENDYNIHTHTRAPVRNPLTRYTRARSACVIVFRNRFHLQRRGPCRPVGTPSGEIRRRCAKISERTTHVLVTFPTSVVAHLFPARVFRLCKGQKRHFRRRVSHGVRRAFQLPRTLNRARVPATRGDCARGVRLCVL